VRNLNVSADPPGGARSFSGLNVEAAGFGGAAPGSLQRADVVDSDFVGFVARRRTVLLNPRHY
jgi:hypothetical protein